MHLSTLQHPSLKKVEWIASLSHTLSHLSAGFGSADKSAGVSGCLGCESNPWLCAVQHMVKLQGCCCASQRAATCCDCKGASSTYNTLAAAKSAGTLSTKTCANNQQDAANAGVSAEQVGDSIPRRSDNIPMLARSRCVLCPGVSDKLLTDCWYPSSCLFYL